MPAFDRISPEEAQTLMTRGHAYVDVRTEEEFATGHVPGAYNVPYRRRGAPNPDFLAVMRAAFATDAPLVIGCQTGVRSLKAANELEQAGFTGLVELRTGFDGSRDAFGRPEPGWSKKGLPVETETPPERTYAELRKRAG